jgi:hypothetical protein
MPATTAPAGAGFSQSSRPGGYGALFQRASIITGLAPSAEERSGNQA